jgi:hypothetical protein
MLPFRTFENIKKKARLTHFSALVLQRVIKSDFRSLLAERFGCANTLGRKPSLRQFFVRWDFYPTHIQLKAAVVASAVQAYRLRTYFLGYHPVAFLLRSISFIIKRV